METIAVVGLGYVGLPLVVEFGKTRRTIGFDIDVGKVSVCRSGRDPSREIPIAEMKLAQHAEYTADPSLLGEADIILVAVPTPVDEAHIPDFGPLLSASRTIGPHMKAGAIVVYESTVYPGATEEVCIPALEAASGRRWQHDFFVGYSPERINPGDREHVLTNVIKVVSGDTPESAAARRGALRVDRQARRLPLHEHQGRRGVQGDREHPARPEHRLDERIVDHLRARGRRYRRGARSGRDEMELPEVQARSGRRSLHRR